MIAAKKILYLVADDRYFCSHRLPLAVLAQQQGYQVFVAAPAKNDYKRIQKAGLTFCPLYFDRGGLNHLSIFRVLNNHLYFSVRKQKT